MILSLKKISGWVSFSTKISISHSAKKKNITFTRVACVGSEAFVVGGTRVFAEINWTVECFESFEEWIALLEEGVWGWSTLFRWPGTGGASTWGNAKFTCRWRWLWPSPAPKRFGRWVSIFVLSFFLGYWCSRVLVFYISKALFGLLSPWVKWSFVQWNNIKLPHYYFENFIMNWREVSI